MKGWETKTLGDIADIRGGKRVPKGYKLQSEPTGHPYVTVSDFTDDGTIDTSNLRYVSDAVFQTIKRYTISADDLYLSIAGTIGKTGYVPPELDGASLTENACKLVLHPGVDLDYVYYFTKSDSFIRQAGANTRVAAQPKLALERLKTIKLAIADSLPEQRRIVAILDQAFEGIATAKANAEKNLQNARALFESHLQSVFSQRGEGWEKRVPLSSILSVQPRNGWSPPAEYQTGTGFPVLTLSSVTGFEYDGSRVKMSSAPTRESAHYWLQAGELLITRSNTRELVGHVAIYDGTPAKAICCDLIMKMKVDASKAATRFVYYFLRSPDARAYLTGRAQGASSTMKKIGKQVVQDILVPLPPLSEQRAAVALLDNVLAESRNLASIYERKLAALEALKKALLHQAFSGKL